MDNMTLKEQDNNIVIKDMEQSYLLIGLLNTFVNRLQTTGDRFFEEISWKQCFLIICIKLFECPPTLGELADAVGSSHQNVKQMLIKLEKAGFVQLIPDEKDRRKQRVLWTEKAESFDGKYMNPSDIFVKQLYSNVTPEDLEVTVKTILQLEDNLKEMNV